MANLGAPFYYEKALGISHCNNPCSFPLLLCCYVLTQLISRADETEVVLLDHPKLGVDIIQIISHCSNLRNKSGNLHKFSRKKKHSTRSNYHTGTVALGNRQSLIFRRCKFKHTNNIGLFSTYVTHLRFQLSLCRHKRLNLQKLKSRIQEKLFFFLIIRFPVQIV